MANGTMTDQEYVESRWEKVRLDRGSFLRLDKIIHEDSGNFRVLADHPTMSGAKLILSGNSNSLFERSHHLSQPAAWMAARAFTEAHEEKIRQLREEIAEQNGYLFHGRESSTERSARKIVRTLWRRGT